MKILFAFLIPLLLLTACSKREAISDKPVPGKDAPEMLITDLKNAEVKDKKSQAIDLNLDSKTDLVFATWYIGNPNEKEDEILFFAGSGIESSLFVGGENDSPVYRKNEPIPVAPANGFDWYIVAQAEMAKKNIGMTGDPYWEKSWRDASHKYLAVRILKDGQFYYGWVEVSMDKANSRLILHSAGISKVAGKPVKAGI